jgi:hypothetical protein
MKEILKKYLSKTTAALKQDFSHWPEHVQVISKIHFQDYTKCYLQRPGFTPATKQAALHPEFFDTAKLLAKEFVHDSSLQYLEKLLEVFQLKALDANNLEESVGFSSASFLGMFKLLVVY